MINVSSEVEWLCLDHTYRQIYSFDWVLFSSKKEHLDQRMYQNSEVWECMEDDLYCYSVSVTVNCVNSEGDGKVYRVSGALLPRKWWNLDIL